MIPGYRANVRSTDDAVLGVVSDRYRIVQNEEAFQFTDDLLGEGVTYETAGSLQGGKKVWILCQIFIPEIVADNVLCILSNRRLQIDHIIKSTRSQQGWWHINKQVGGFVMNIPDGFFENPVSPEYSDLLSTMGAPIFFTAPPCHTSGYCEYIDCSAITLRDQSQFFNCGYVVPPLNAQYEVVQPDLHSLERYDFSKEPDLPWYP